MRARRFAVSLRSLIKRTLLHFLHGVVGNLRDVNVYHGEVDPSLCHVHHDFLVVLGLGFFCPVSALPSIEPVFTGRAHGVSFGAVSEEVQINNYAVRLLFHSVAAYPLVQIIETAHD
jgi:hypothetical protein